MKQRVTYLDNLKLFLTVLVIAHHTCQAYTIGGSWIVKDVNTAPSLSSFLTINMTFFMGAFFFIAGYFIPPSRLNRSRLQYTKKKASRLLVPIIGLLIVVVPIYFYIAYWNANLHPESFFTYYFHMYWGEGLFSYEHGWFLISLFLYSMFYLLIEKLCDRVKGTLTITKIIVFYLIMTVLTTLIRFIYPIDEWVDVLGVIGIEPAHLPQYLLWFIAGTMAYKNHWLDQITKPIGRGCIVIGCTTSLAIICKNVLPNQVIDFIYDIFPVYESLMSVTIIIGLVYLFHLYFDHQNKLVAAMSKQAFNAYLVHNLFVIIFQVAFCQITMNAYLKFILATFLAVICSFGFMMLAVRCKRIKS